MCFGQRAFLIRTSRANQLQTQVLGPLASNQAHTTGCGMKQHKVTRLQAANWQGFLEQILSRQALKHHGRPGLKADGVGQHTHVHGWHDTQFGVRAWRL